MARPNCSRTASAPELPARYSRTKSAVESHGFGPFGEYVRIAHIQAGTEVVVEQYFRKVVLHPVLRREFQQPMCRKGIRHFPDGREIEGKPDLSGFRLDSLRYPRAVGAGSIAGFQGSVPCPCLPGACSDYNW